MGPSFLNLMLTSLLSFQAAIPVNVRAVVPPSVSAAAVPNPDLFLGTLNDLIYREIEIGHTGGGIAAGPRQ